jgi:hypothetical protein
MRTLECSPSISSSRSPCTGSIRSWISSELAAFLRPRKQVTQINHGHRYSFKGAKRRGQTMQRWYGRVYLDRSGPEPCIGCAIALGVRAGTGSWHGGGGQRRGCRWVTYWRHWDEEERKRGNRRWPGPVCVVSDWKMLPGPGRRLGPGSIAWVACLTSNQTGLRLQRCMLDVSNLYPTFLHCFNYYFMIVFLNHLTSLDAFDNTNARIRWGEGRDRWWRCKRGEEERAAAWSRHEKGETCVTMYVIDDKGKMIQITLIIGFKWLREIVFI